MSLTDALERLRARVEPFEPGKPKSDEKLIYEYIRSLESRLHYVNRQYSGQSDQYRMVAEQYYREQEIKRGEQGLFG